MHGKHAKRECGVPDSFGSGPGPSNRNFNDTILTALSNANQGVTTTTASQDVRQKKKKTADKKQQKAGPSAPSPPAPPLPAPNRRRPQRAVERTAAGRATGIAPPLPELPQTATVTYAGGTLGAANGRFATGTYQNFLALRFAQRQFFGDVRRSALPKE